MVPFGVSAYRLAKEIFIPQKRVSEILKGNRRISADTALRLSRYFSNSPAFWLGLQTDYDLEEAFIKNEKELNEIKPIQGSAA